MKITNITQGESYELDPDTELSIERTNPFFHEWGEQSAPVDLPDTGRNRRLLNLDHFLASNQKASTTIETSIEDGDYYAVCRQAVLGMQRNETIKTSFYLNEGSFYARLNETTLQDVFKEKTVDGVTTVQEGIDFCRSLVDNKNDKFGIFPVLITGESTGEYKWLNRYGTNYYFNPPLGIDFFDTSDKSRDADFYNAIPRNETYEDLNISLEAGYYITPFLRLHYVLKCIFKYFGYDLKDNLFTLNTQLNKICIVNNIIDTLMTGTIRLSELLPERTCNSFLNTIRKKFCCEFIPDEVNQTVIVRFFKDIIETKTITFDLTNAITNQPNIDFSSYKNVVLSSTEHIGTSLDFKSLDAVKSKYPTLMFSPSDGCFYRNGFKGMNLVVSRLTDSSLPYAVKSKKDNSK